MAPIMRIIIHMNIMAMANMPCIPEVPPNMGIPMGV